MSIPKQKKQPAFKVLIVDDEPLARQRLKNLCQDIPYIRSTQLVESGPATLALVEQAIPDIVLLDIDMPEMSGIELARWLQTFSRAPQIIFTTAHSRYAAEAFRFNATDYLLKPVKRSQLSEAFQRAVDRVEQKDLKDNIKIWVQDHRGTVQVDSNHISWIAAERDYMRIHSEENSYLILETMHSLEARLPKGQFMRIHRSTIVRESAIQQFRRKGRQFLVVLLDGTELPIGRSYAGGLGLSETVTE